MGLLKLWDRVMCRVMGLNYVPPVCLEVSVKAPSLMQNVFLKVFIHLLKQFIVSMITYKTNNCKPLSFIVFYLAFLCQVFINRFCWRNNIEEQKDFPVADSSFSIPEHIIVVFCYWFNHFECCLFWLFCNVVCGFTKFYFRS